MKFGTWNVSTLIDNPNSDRLECRTAIVGRELRRFNVDTASQSGTRQAGEGQLNEQGGGYTFFWKGKPEEERRLHEVGFAFKNKLVDCLKGSPCGVNQSLMTLQLTLPQNQCAPTLDATDEAKEGFYSSLEQSLSRVPTDDKLILLSNFNARVGFRGPQDIEALEKVQE